MAFRGNPVRAQYALLGTLQLAGIFNEKDLSTGLPMTFIGAETAGHASLTVQDPASLLWITQHSLNRAMRHEFQATKGAYVIDPDHPVITQGIVDYLKSDRASKYTTEDFIVKMSGGETPERRAYAQEQLAALEAYYLPASASAAA
jgi:hypothetical protein